MSYTAPQYVDTKEQAILALASTIKGEAVTGGDGSVNRALDILADVLAEQDVQVPQTDAGAILALAQYVSGGGGGGGDLTTANVTLVNTTQNADLTLPIPRMDEEYEESSYEAYVERATSATVKAILYKGACRAYNKRWNVTVSGDAVYTPSLLDPTSGPITITGDCTITFSAPV